MNLVLGIETSMDPYQVVLGDNATLLFDSARDCRCQPSRDMGCLLSCGLGLVGARISNIALIAVNIGPGGLSSIRAGVSFANALAFSLGIPVYPFNYFELVGHQASKITELPVLCVLPAAGDSGYAGLFSDGLVKITRFGPLPSVVASIAGGLTEVAVAGRFRDRVSLLLPGTKIFDTGIEKPDAKILLDMGHLAQKTGSPTASQANPLNEQAAMFYEQT